MVGSSKGKGKMNTGSAGMTPMLKQYQEIKASCPDAILFYRMGDFYEMFFEDAVEASRILEITLTSRDRNKDKRIPMCGVPVHTADIYLTRLVKAGKRVAVCEQVEDPRKAKGLVRREVVRILTPGLITTEGSLGAKKNNFLLSLFPGSKGRLWGLSYLDISTGEFRLTELDNEEGTLAEISRLEPSEILLPESLKGTYLVAKVKQVICHAFLTLRPDALFSEKTAEDILKEHFSTLSLDGFGISGLKQGIGAAGALLSYALETQKGRVGHIVRIAPYSLKDHLLIDESTKRNLELVANSVDHGRHGSLLEVMDSTVTPMGGRLLRKWMLYPLRNIKEINRRLDAVEVFKEETEIRRRLRKELRKVYDLERLIGKVVLGTANARDLLSLKESTRRLPGILACLKELAGHLPDSNQDHPIHSCVDHFDILEDINSLIESAIRDDCPTQLREGRLIKQGYNRELDELIEIHRNGKSFIAGIEAKEREKTGIASLKVGYNRVFGYFIEVTKSQASKVPDDYVRKQTLVSAERYVTPALKEAEAKILSAQERRLSIEYELFQEIRQKIAGQGSRIQKVAAILAEVDCLSSLGTIAQSYDYCRPELNLDNGIIIKEGRHPVVERSLDEEFVPNDIKLDHQFSQLIIITGPNMAGKSTVLRQTALIVLMAQMGSFVPASSATIGLVDRIFTRVGATDYLAKGQSTFMVEMSETANILHNATGRSLVILDEIGRGTSTYDGLSIAWSVAEHLLFKDGTGVKTLFATHYHELTELAKKHKKVRNMHIAVKEWDGRISFLRRLQDGATNRSYGIQVAALAGVPKEVIRTAKEFLSQIEKGHTQHGTIDRYGHGPPRAAQMVLPLVIDKGATLRKRILDADLDNMTPIEALNFLAELKKNVKKS